MGTTTPGAPLEVDGAANTNVLKVIGGNGTSDAAYWLINNKARFGWTGTTVQLNDNGQGNAIDFRNNATERFWIDPTGTFAIGAGAENGTPLATLDIRPNANAATGGTLAVASISGKTSFAGLVVDNKGSGDLFTASSSGLNRFVITQAGNVGYWDNIPKENAA